MRAFLSHSSNRSRFSGMLSSELHPGDGANHDPSVLQCLHASLAHISHYTMPAGLTFDAQIAIPWCVCPCNSLSILLSMIVTHVCTRYYLRATKVSAVFLSMPRTRLTISSSRSSQRYSTHFLRQPAALTKTPAGSNHSSLSSIHRAHHRTKLVLFLTLCTCF